MFDDVSSRKSEKNNLIITSIHCSFTLVELLVVIAIIAILASLLMPSLIKTLRSAHDLACTNNIRQLNLGILHYADDYHGACPSYSGYGYGSHLPWQTEITPYLGTETKIDVSNGNNSWVYYDGAIWKPVSKIFICPSQELETSNKILLYGKHYAINFDMSWPQDGNNYRITRVKRPSSRFLLADIDTDSNTGATCITSNTMFGLRHINFSGSSVAFADGHVKNEFWVVIPIRSAGEYFWGWKCNN